jgi:hypothetical protein
MGCGDASAGTPKALAWSQFPANAASTTHNVNQVAPSAALDGVVRVADHEVNPWESVVPAVRGNTEPPGSWACAFVTERTRSHGRFRNASV